MEELGRIRVSSSIVNRLLREDVEKESRKREEERQRGEFSRETGYRKVENKVLTTLQKSSN